MNRIVVGRGGRLHTRVSGPDEEPVTPDSGAVTITADDGTTVISDGEATVGDGLLKFDLGADDVPRLDTLRVHWTAQADGDAIEVVTVAEVVGGFLFDLADVREDATLASLPAEKVVRERIHAEQELEAACNYALVPRYTREAATYVGDGRLRVEGRHIRAIRSLKVDGTALTTAQLEQLRTPGVFTIAGVTQAGSRYEVAYEHGLDQPPAGAREAALALAKYYLVDTGVDDRAVSLTTELGTVRLGAALPKVEAFLANHARAAAGMLP